MIEFKPNEIKFDNSLYNNFLQHIKTEIPNEFVEYLKKYNGGYIENCVSSYENEGKQNFLLTALFGIGLDSKIDLLSQSEMYNGRIPKGYIPIGMDAGGNLVCMNINSTGFGTIYFWNHEEEKDEMTLEDIYFVAESFSEFANMLKEDSKNSSDMDGYEVKKAWIDPEFFKEIQGK